MPARAAGPSSNGDRARAAIILAETMTKASLAEQNNSHTLKEIGDTADNAGLTKRERNQGNAMTSKATSTAAPTDSGDTEEYRQAIQLLHACSTEDGFIASRTDRDNYRRIWARDGVIVGLAALMSKDQDLIETLRRTLLTLTQYQGPHGEIPSNVDMATVSMRSRIFWFHYWVWQTMGNAKRSIGLLAMRALSRTIWRCCRPSIRSFNPSTAIGKTCR